MDGIPDPTRPGAGGEAPPRARPALLLGTLGALIVPLLLFAMIRILGPQFERDALDSLEVTARLKALMVESWLAERQRDGELFAQDGELADLLARPGAIPGGLRVLRQRIETLRERYGYPAAALLDPQGQILIRLGDGRQISDEAAALLGEAFTSGRTLASRFYEDPFDGLLAFDFIVPLLREEGATRRPLGALVLHIEPSPSIFALILAWPTASGSGETLVVRRDGESVVYLSPLRHTDPPGQRLRLPANAAQLLSANALRAGGSGTLSGLDYRGTEVLAAHRPIAGTDWQVIAKIDRAEVRAPLWQLVGWMTLLALPALLAIAFLLRRHAAQQERLYRLAAHAREMQQLRESEARYRAVTETARDAIVTADAEGRIVGWNSSATRTFGFTPGEIIGQPLTRIVPERFHRRAVESFRRLLDGDPDGLDGSVAELLARRKDGSEVLVERSIALWQTAEGRFYTCAMRDITERRTIEDKLRLQGAALEASASAIVITDQHGTLLWANPAFCSLSGYSLEEAVGQKPQTLVKSGVESRTVYESLWTTILSGRVWQGELVNRRKDGSLYVEEQTITPLRDPGGTIRHFIAIKQDITERKRQEERTRELLATNETILANAMVGIAYIRHRHIHLCNRRLEELFQYAPGELAGRSSELLYESRETYDAIGDEAYRAIGEGRSFSTEVRLRHKDGSVFWGALSGRAIDPGQPHEGSIWVYADITERRLAEQETSKLLQAVEQSPVSIVISNREGVIEYVNPSFTRITGFTRRDAIGQKPSILKSELTPRATHEDLWRTILSGRIWHGILQNRRKNGQLIWEETTISPIFDAVGEITHFVAVKDDVTERKRIEEELREHQARLEELVHERTAELSKALAAAKLADRSKDEFLANITHELRTPLAAVIGFSSLARPMCTDPRQREYLDKVNSAGKTLSGIIDDLLDLSKIVAGRLEFEVAPFSLRQTVSRTRSVISFKAQEKGLALVERISDEVPDILIGNSLRIEQILLNLLSNAVKFTTAGRVELRIDVLRREAERVCLLIAVEDTGMGLSEEAIARLFQPFSQADASITRRFGGTGLGLAICRRLAQMMDGDISVNSQEGVGSTFRVHLWLAVGQPGDLPVDAAPDAEAAPQHYRNARVLVVDDQPFNRDVVEGLLAAVGITPELACNGLQALERLERAREPFDLVLMDIQMPVMDGLAATRAIRSQKAFIDLPVVAMTAHTMTHEKEQSFASGMSDHIGKPFDEATFYRVLAKWIPRHKQQNPPPPAPPPESAGGPGDLPGLPALPGIDTRAGLALLLGDTARYRHWLTAFVREAPEALRDIRAALADGRPQVAGMAVHALKGRTGLLGMKDAHGVATALETAIAQGDAQAAELLLQLEHAVDALCAVLRDALGEPAAADTAPAPDPAPPRGERPPALDAALALLRAGDPDAVRALESCLAEHRDGDWGACLERALTLTRNFDFAAAARLIEGGCPLSGAPEWTS